MTFGFGLKKPIINYVHYVTLILLAGFTGFWYFKGKGVKNGAGQGFLLGIMMMLTGIVLDLIITAPIFAKVGYSGFFGDVYRWIGIVEAVIITTIAGAMKK